MLRRHCLLALCWVLSLAGLASVPQARVVPPMQPLLVRADAYLGAASYRLEALGVTPYPNNKAR